MATSGVNNIVNQFDTKNNSASTKFAQDFDTFLLILTTQMKNQDPSSPLDSKDMIAQMTQMASVEQQINQSQLLTELVKQGSKNDLLTASSVVGKNVEVLGNTFKISAGEENISKKLVYAHATDAGDTKITVYNSSGSPVYTTTGNNNAGKHSFIWDGKDANGNTVPAGNYTVTVEEKKIGAETYQPLATNLVSKVKEVLLVEGEIYVNFGDFTVPFDSVLGVAEPETTNS